MRGGGPARNASLSEGHLAFREQKRQMSRMCKFAARRFQLVAASERGSSDKGRPGGTAILEFGQELRYLPGSCLRPFRLWKEEEGKYILKMGDVSRLGSCIRKYGTPCDRPPFIWREGVIR